MKQVTLQLTPEEVKIMEETLRDSLSYVTSLDISVITSSTLTLSIPSSEDTLT